MRATALQPMPGPPAELGALMAEELAAFRRLQQRHTPGLAPQEGRRP